jgi:phenylalanyl-tRNA synthetase alpha subunit
MFENLKKLVDSLEEGTFTSYKEVKDSRKVLQSIKIEAQSLRNNITNKFKEFKKLPKVKKEKAVKEVKPVEDEETKLVSEDDDDFFAK